MYDPLVLTPVVESSPSARRFTRAEADRSLVYLRPVARDVRACYGEVVRLRGLLDGLPEGERPGTAAVAKDFRRAMDRLAELADEVAAAGVELLDFEAVRLAFPAAKGDGCFTWQLGEKRVAAELSTCLAAG